MKIKDMVEGRRYLLKDRDSDDPATVLTEIICLEISAKAIKIKYATGETLWWRFDGFDNYFEIFEDLGTITKKENEDE